MSDSCKIGARIATVAVVAALLAAGAPVGALHAEPLSKSSTRHHARKAVEAKPAAVQRAPAERSPLNLLGFTTNAGPMPDFVEKSRPPAADLHYVPLGGGRPEPSDRPLTPDQIRAQEAELDALRARQDRIVGRKTVTGFRSAAPVPVKPKKAAPVNCVLTCAVGAISRQNPH